MNKKIVLLCLMMFHGQMFAGDIMSFACTPTTEVDEEAAAAKELNKFAFLFSEGEERPHRNKIFVKRGNSFVPKNTEDFSFDAYKVEVKFSSGNACKFIINDTYFRSLEMSRALAVGNESCRLSDQALWQAPTSNFAVRNKDSGEVLLNIWDKINELTP
jgi:hypothetical protein